MRKILLAFIITLSCFMGVSAGNLNKWTNYNFQGVWEITSTDSDVDVSWIAPTQLRPYIGEAPITKIELAIDFNGYGYICYQSSDGVAYGEILGRIYVPHFDENYSDCLSLLSSPLGANGMVGGLLSWNVSAYNGDASDKDAFAIHSINGMCNAKAIRTNNIYIPSAISEVTAPSMQLQFQEDGISVVDADNSNVSVFNIEGVLMYQTQDYAGETIKLAKGACYIVKVDESSMKIAL